MLKANQPAPDFEAPNQVGNPIGLKDFKGAEYRALLLSKG